MRGERASRELAWVLWKQAGSRPGTGRDTAQHRPVRRENGEGKWDAVFGLLVFAFSPFATYEKIIPGT